MSMFVACFGVKTQFWYLFTLLLIQYPTFCWVLQSYHDFWRNHGTPPCGWFRHFPDLISLGLNSSKSSKSPWIPGDDQNRYGIGKHLVPLHSLDSVHSDIGLSENGEFQWISPFHVTSKHGILVCPILRQALSSIGPIGIASTMMGREL